MGACKISAPINSSVAHDRAIPNKRHVPPRVKKEALERASLVLLSFEIKQHNVTYAIYLSQIAVAIRRFLLIIYIEIFVINEVFYQID